jgi:uncharacterized protein with LGFP repeats
VNNPPSTYVIPSTLSTPGDAQGSNSIVGGEVDFYRFTTPQGGTYLFDATSPGHAVDTVIAVYDANGNRLGYNNDVAPGNTDSEVSVNLPAGQQFYFGITSNLATSTHGAYNWSIDGPVHRMIELKARALGSKFTGSATSDLQTFLSGSGYFIRYTNCDIFGSLMAAYEVDGPILLEYAATSQEKDAYYGTDVQQFLGLPTSDEMDVPGVSGARMNTFQGGTIYWSSAPVVRGAHVVYGVIGAKYNSLGGPAGYGLPTSDEASLPGLLPGARVVYFQDGRAIDWWAGTASGAHAIYGAIEAEYAATAQETDAFGGFLHIPPKRYIPDTTRS